MESLFTPNTLIMLGIQLVTAGIFIGGLVGTTKVLETMIKAIKDDIIRLEQKQDKHNNVIERVCIVEQSCKSAHHRLDYYDKKENKK